jgi:hypothetical protein
MFSLGKDKKKKKALQLQVFLCFHTIFCVSRIMGAFWYFGIALLFLKLKSYAKPMFT